VLAEAINLSREAVHLRPPGHPYRFLSLKTLADALEASGDHGGPDESLLEVISLYREALQGTPHGHWRRVEALESLARVLCRPEHRAWTEAHALYHEALALCPEGYPARTRLLSGLSHCFLDPESSFFDLSRGVSLLADGYADNFSDVGQRVKSAVFALRRVETAFHAAFKEENLMSAMHSAPDILQLYIQVIGLLPRAANFGLNHHARLHAVVGSDEIARNAAARAAVLGRVTQAVELLEEGRGIFWSQSLHLRRDDFDGVPDGDHNELKRMLLLLEQGGRTLPSPNQTAIQRERHLENRIQLNEAAEAQISKIRSYYGLERFLLPAAFDSLFAALPDGFVVIVNASVLGHHALILNKASALAEILDLRPTKFGFDFVTLRARLPRDWDLDAQQDDCYSTGSRAMRLDTGAARSLDEILAVLWTSIVQPVFTKLDLPVSV
jgi:hypothetical protein